MSVPRVSVLMCAYNGVGLIERAVADIVGQSFADWELIVSDDGSSDGTRDYLGSLDDPRIRILLQPRNLGYVANKNAAFAAARGTFLTQQDQDDRSHPDRLMRQVEAAERSGKVIVGCGYRRIGPDDRLLFQTELSEEVMLDAPEVGRPYPFWFPALMIHRTVFERIGPFDTHFAGAFGDDLYWTVRAHQHYPILCLPDRLYDYVESQGSITSCAGSDRKLIMAAVLDHLVRQRVETGTDDLEQGMVGELEARLLADRRLLASSLRTYAARAIDQQRWDEARILLKRAWRIGTERSSWLRTYLYYLRSRLRSPHHHP